ncbi:hypothetical protein [Longispora albida]|uniref:hypothetical protein n=1 Tax=Longispora albida TaxID=203523 RepID=UPI00037DDE1A|nr:hypothetical protein [Longispora albida]
MAMTLRLPEATQELLKHYAAQEGVSAHSAAVAAISSWIEQRQEEEVRHVAGQILTEDAELLHRLGNS